jgi:acyl-coenzyme A synthetase/AMP-(fatty) acid ligase
VTHPVVREAAAVGLPGPGLGTARAGCGAGAGRTPSSDRPTKGEAPGSALSAMRPSWVVFIAALPVTRSGKILRADLQGPGGR